MNATRIEWCDATANPIRAAIPVDGISGHYCEKISPGCAKCYASTLQTRFRMPGFPGVTRDDQTTWTDGVMSNGVTPYLDADVLQKLTRGRKPKRVFLGDMTDIFGWWVPDAWLDQIFAAMACSPNTFLILTKRPERMREYMESRSKSMRHWDEAARQLGLALVLEFHATAYSRPIGLVPFPLPNVWLGVSAEDQKRWDERVPILEQTPAAGRFVSAEPLLGPINMDFIHHDWVTEIDWVIFGGESGRGARPCRVEWIRDGLRQCREAGVAPFVKQLGSIPQPRDMVRHKKGGDMTEWPEDLRVREFPE